MIRRLLFIFSCVYLSFAFTACGDLLRSLRQESLAADGIDPEEQDRKREQRLAEEEYKPRRLDGLSANNNPNYNLSARREYARQPASVQSDENGGSGEPAPRRFTRNDFVDSATNENSLWNGQGQNNYLFTQNRKNEVGDLVTVEVERDLRRDIQYSLWLTLPPHQRKPKKKVDRDVASTDGKAAAASAQNKAQEATKSALEKGKDDAEEAAKSNMASADDLLRMEVVEQLGNGIVKAIGQKRVVYKGQSRMVETSALINSKDIDEGGRIKSSAFVDVSSQVVQ